MNQKPNKILISSNENPDLDGYACAIGYAEFLKNQGQLAEAILLGNPQVEIKFVAEYLNNQFLSPFQGNINDYNSIVIVDTSNLDTLKKGIEPTKLKLIIDHRMANDSYLYPKAEKEIEAVGACATLVAEKFIKNDIKLNQKTATYLYAAIISNTINFQNKITTTRDIKAANYLKSLINLPNNFIEKMFRAKSDLSSHKLREYLSNDYIEQNLKGKTFTIFQMEIVDSKKLIKNRLNEIKEIINKITNNKKLNFCFLNIIDTIKAYNYILTKDNQTAELLNKVLNINFKNNLAKTDHIIMRKEIMAKIKDYFENK